MPKKKDDDPTSAENIKVLVRCRPLNDKEKASGYKSCVDLNLAENTVQVNHVCGTPDRWTFDAVINNTYAQKDIFTQYIMPMIDSVMDGFNSTVFAYGQSGSGKTHTMMGKYEDEEMMGLIPRTFKYVFDVARQTQQTNPNRHYAIYCSYVELYNGKVRDLLARQQVTLAVKENKDKTFYVQGAHIPPVKFVEELTRWMEEGTERRQVSSTELNADSSRSHSIFTLLIESIETSDEGDTRSVTSKFNLVDLAGSERQSKTGAQGDTLKEGCNINLSLSSLGTVIDCLVKGKPHVPFRQSPLTMLLKDSLGGSSKTVMFANIGPSEHNLSETVSTLRFADRAKQIKNKPVVNMDTKDQKIVELTEQVQALKEKLKQYEGEGVKDLEAEIERLTERVGELEIDVDNVTKSREADLVEFQEKRQNLEQELRDALERSEQLQVSLSAAEQEIKVTESRIEDERAQREELWSLCTLHLGALNDNDALIVRLKELNSGVSGDQHQAVVAQLLQVQTEARIAKDQFLAELQEANAEKARIEGEMEQLGKKLEKAKEKLEKERDVRKQLVEAHNEASPQKVHGEDSMAKSQSMSQEMSQFLQHKRELEKQHELELAARDERIRQLEGEAEGQTEVQELNDELSRLRKEKADEVNQLREELKKACDVATAPSDDDSVAVQNLKRLVTAKDESLLHARNEVKALEEQIDALKARSKARRGSLVGASVVTPKVSSEGGPSAFAAANGGVEHNIEQRQALRQELETTTKHRDDLLRIVIQEDDKSAEPESLDLKTELRRIADENQALRERLKKSDALADVASDAQLREKDAQERLAELERELEAVGADRASSNEKELKDLRLQNENLIDQLEKARAEFSEREQSLIKAVAKAKAKPRPQQQKEEPSTTVSEQAQQQQGDEEPLASTESPTQAKRSKNKSENDNAEDEDDDDENPLQSLVEMLQADKTNLNGEVSRLSKEVNLLKSELAKSHASTVSPGKQAAKNKKQQQRLEDEASALKAEVARLKADMAAPKDGDSDELLKLKKELQLRTEEVANLSKVLEEGGGSAKQTQERESTDALASPRVSSQEVVEMRSTITQLEDDNRTAIAELRSKLGITEANNQDMASELESLRAELAEETQRREAASKEHQSAIRDVGAAKKEVTAAQTQVAELEAKIQQLEGSATKVSQESEQYTTTIAKLEGKVKERQEQLQDLRKMIDGQKAVMDTLKGKAEQAQQHIAQLKEESAQRELQHQQHLSEQEEQFQKMMNRRLEQQAEEHRKALSRKDDETAQARKKYKKLEDKIEKWKERYDVKVGEYEELISLMENQKLEAMKNMKEKDVIEFEEGQEQVRDALKAAREAKSKRLDAFENGETTSSVMARPPKQPKKRSTNVTPTTEGIDPPVSKSPRPQGYQQGTARVNAENYRGGGAGFSSTSHHNPQPNQSPQYATIASPNGTFGGPPPGSSYGAVQPGAGVYGSTQKPAFGTGAFTQTLQQQQQGGGGGGMGGGGRNQTPPSSGGGDMYDF